MIDLQCTFRNILNLQAGWLLTVPMPGDNLRTATNHLEDLINVIYGDRMQDWHC